MSRGRASLPTRHHTARDGSEGTGVLSRDPRNLSLSETRRYGDDVTARDDQGRPRQRRTRACFPMVLAGRDFAHRTRPPDEKEMGVAMDFLKKQSLADFAHVLLNLNEFLYVR